MINKIKKYEDLQVWRDGIRLVIEVYKSFKTCNDYSLRDQMQKAAASIPFNISKGFEKPSHKEFIQSLHIANSSCAELRKHISQKIKSGILDKSKGKELTEQTRKISAMLHKLIQQDKINSKNPDSGLLSPVPQI